MFTLKILVLVLPALSTTPVPLGVATYVDLFDTKEACEDFGRTLAPKVKREVADLLHRAESTATIYGVEPKCFSAGVGI